MTSEPNIALSKQPALHHPDEETIKDFLMSAALHSLEKVKFYVEDRGLHPDTTYGGKPTALCYAVLKPNRPLLNYLLDQGADSNHVDQMGMTPLHYAALGGCIYCLSSLVNVGAKLNEFNRCGETALALALNRQNSPEGIDYLIRSGASMEKQESVIKTFH
ncbi:MAG: ankyrin repeat domain-containing protein [Pseudomonadota bacterium]